MQTSPDNPSDKLVPARLGTPAGTSFATFVMTEREAHEAWALLSVKAPRAAALLHLLVAHMGPRNAVVVGQKMLAKMMGVTDRTIRTAVQVLVADRWISTVKLNGPGTVMAYVVNDQVSWGESRDKMHLSIFSAQVIADRDDQDRMTIERTDLRKIPLLFSNERQLPTGPGLDPPSQPHIDGMEPDLPAKTADSELEEAVKQIERFSAPLRKRT
jgi:hypothetical protein